jgi:hypothetical protein
MSIRLPAASSLIMALLAQALVSGAPQQTDAPRAARGRTPQARAKAATRVDDRTPEGAWRSFVIAMLSRDEATLKTLALPAEGLEWLLKGEAPPQDALAQIKDQIGKQRIGRLKPGDRFTLPGGRIVVVAPEEVGPDRAVLVPEGDPIPTRVQRVAGHWKVDARPLIVARRMADAARKKADARKAGGPG